MADITTQALDCPNGMPAYLALPAGTRKVTAKVPGVIILHERYGFVQHPHDVAERFAQRGMAGMAINGFFKCDFQPSLADGTKRYYMTDPESVEYMTSAVAALKASGRVDPAKIAVLGMCQTGRHPFMMAADSDLIAAAVCWYGAGMNSEFETGKYYPKPLADTLARVKCPVLGQFGENDNHIPVANVRRMRDILEQHGKTFEIRVYGNALHGFLNDRMPERYSKPQADAAWVDMMNFLNKAFSGAFAGGRIIQRYDADLSP
jgi:carboxymethylenebutenolidase